MSSLARARAARLLLTLLLLGCGGAAYGVSTNDTFATRTALPSILPQTNITGDNTGATAETGEPAASGTVNSLWWKWTSPITGRVNISLKGSSFDTYVSVYTGTAVNALTLVGANDDNPNNGGSLQSLLNIPVSAGQEYEIQVDGFQANVGSIVMAIQAMPTLSVTSGSNAKEPSTAGSVTLSLSSTVVDPLSVTFVVSGGTATNGSDYTAPTIVVFPASTSSMTVSVPVIDDAISEGNESISLGLSNPGTTYGYTTSASTATIVIADDEPIYVASTATGANNGTSWANAYTSLATALGSAMDGNQIWVKAGTYTPTSSADRTASFFLKSGVSVFGGFAGNESTLLGRNWAQNRTVLSGDIGAVGDNTDNSYQVVNASAGGSIDGFIITRGMANNGSVPYGGGAGLFAAGAGPAAIVVHCVFTNNTATYNGGAAFLNNGASVSFRDCLFVNNSGGSYGGAISLQINSIANVTGCTFALNSAAFGQAAMVYSNSTLTLTDSILWDGGTSTSPIEVYNYPASTPVTNVSFCDIQGSGGSSAWVAAEGTNLGSNLDADPKFQDPAHPEGADNIFGTSDDGLRLMVGSPCVDIGTASGSARDLLSSTRTLGPLVDLGCYEGKLPTISFAATNSSGSESTTAVGLSVVLNGASDLTVNVAYAVSGGTATGGGVDYTLNSGFLSFAPGTTSQPVPLTVVNDAIQENNETIQVGLVATSNGKLGSPTTHIYTILDDDVAGFTITPNAGTGVVTTTEAAGANHTGAFTVVLNSQPTADVSMTVVSNLTGEGLLSTAAFPSPSGSKTLIFNAANWSTPQTVTVTGVDDFLADGDVTYTITTNAAVSGDPFYNGINPPDVTAKNLDDDVVGVIVPASFPPTSESGATSSFVIKLNSQPYAPVTFNLTSSNTNEARLQSGSQTVILDAGNWQTGVTVTVVGQDDSVADGDQPFHIDIGKSQCQGDGAYNNLGGWSVTSTNVDNDTRGVTITESGGSTAVTEGGATDSYTVVLTSQPTASVTITCAPNSQLQVDTDAGTAGFQNTLLFTPANWNVPQAVTVSAVDDLVAEGVHGGTVTHSASGGDYTGIGINPVNATITDNDTPGFTITPTSGLVTSESSGQATFTVKLASQPTGNVTIGLSSSNGGEGTVSPPSLTFTNGNWNVAQTVTVTGVDDNPPVADGAIAYSIVTSPAVSGDPFYNNLDPADVSVTNNDNDVAGVTIVESSGSTDLVEGGATDSYTMVLNTKPTANVTITINGGSQVTTTPSLSFTQANWNTPQTVTVTAIDDAVAEGAHTGTIIHSAAGGGYNGVSIASVVAHITDNDTAGFTVAPTSGLVTTESGGTATFTVKLTSQPTANVSFGLSSSNVGEGTVGPATLTFTSGNWNVPQTVTVTGVDDNPPVADGPVGYTIITAAAASADPFYSGLNPADVSVTNNDNDVAGVTITESGGSTNVAEGGATDTYTVVLTTQPSSNVTVTATPDAQVNVSPTTLTFTSANWNAPQTVTVTAVDDPDIEPSPHVGTIAHGASGGGYGAVVIASVTASITDNDVAGVTVTPTAGLITSENGDTATFTVVLKSRPTLNVTWNLSSSDLTEGVVSPASVTFTPGTWNLAQTITVTGQDDVGADGDIAYTIVSSAITTPLPNDLNYEGLVPASVSVTNLDNDVPGVTITPLNGLTTSESGAVAIFSARLNTAPNANVRFTLTSSNTAEGTVSPASLTFTPLNWSTPQTATVTGVDDQVADGPVAYTIVTGVVSAAGETTGYVGINPPDVSVTNLDNDTAGVVIAQTGGTTVVTEAGATDTYTVVLATKPTAPVTITPSGDGQVTVAPPSVTFTTLNWNTPKTFTVTAVDDAVAEGVHSGVITHTASGGGYDGVSVPTLTATIIDNDAAGITVTPTSGLATTEAGGTATFTVVLTSQPTAPVTIGLSSSNVAEGTVSPASMTFTSANWSTPQTVTVTGVNDSPPVADGPVAYTVVTAAAVSADPFYSGMNATDVAVTDADDDTAAVVISESGGSTAVSEGGVGDSYTVVLTTQPTGNVTITPTPDAFVTVNPPTLTFTAATWNVPQSVTVTAVDDQIAEGPHTGTITHSASGGGYGAVVIAPVVASVTDNDTAAVLVVESGGVTDVTEGGATDTFTVALATQPTANVTITLAADAQVSLSSTTLTFSTANWMTPKSVTVSAVDDSVAEGNHTGTITGSAAGGGYTGISVASVVAHITDNDAAGITVTPTSGLITTESGGSSVFTVALTSQPTLPVTVGLSSSNVAEGTVSPASVTFTAATWNVPQLVTVTGVNDQVADGSIAYSVVTAAAISADPRYSGLNAADVSVTNQDNDIAGVTIVQSGGATAVDETGLVTDSYTIALNSKPTAVCTVTVSVTDGQTTVGGGTSTTLTFDPAVSAPAANGWDLARTIAVAGVDDNYAEANPHSGVIHHLASGGGYSSVVIPDVNVSIADNDTAGITVAPTSGLVTTEAGGSATFTVVLKSQPRSNVTVLLTSQNESEGTVSPNRLTFQPAQWNQAQTVTVNGVDDAVADGNVNYSVTVDTFSGDANYNGLSSGVAVTNVDNDTSGMIVSAISGNTTEAGGIATFNVRLASQPTAVVTIALDSSNAAEGLVTPATLTFDATDWNVVQYAVVTGQDDFVADGDIAYHITCTPSGLDPLYAALASQTVAIVNLDNDVAGLVVSTASVSVSEGGSPVTFTVALSSQPISPVTIAVAGDDPTEGTVGPASLNFDAGNWNIPQTVTVTPVDDFVVDGDVAWHITLTPSGPADYAALPVRTIAATTHDNDSADFAMSFASPVTTSESGTSRTITIVLSSQPTAPVTIDVTGRNPAEGSLSATSITFAVASAPALGAWNTPQTITVTGVDDFVQDANQTYTLTFTPSSGDAVYAALPPKTVDVTNLDNDVNGVTVVESGGSTTVAERLASPIEDTYTVVLQTDPAGTVTVHAATNGQVLVRRTGALAGSAAATLDLVFDSSNWMTAQSVTVSGFSDGVTDTNAGVITHTVTGYGLVTTAATVNVAVIDDTPPTVITNTPITIVRGQSGVVIGAAKLAASDVENNDPTTLVYRLLLLPGQGTLRRAGTALAAFDTFTQADIDANLITYDHGGSNSPTDGFAFQVHDDAGNQSTLTLYNLNINVGPPVVTLDGTPLAYTEGDGAVRIDQNAQVLDANSADFNGGRVTVSMSLGGEAADVLSVRDVGTGAGQIGFSGGVVTYQGVPIGNASNGVGSDLVIDLLAGSTPAVTTALLQNLTYAHTSRNPRLTTKSVTVVVRDDTNLNSAPQTRPIDVTPVNDPPVVTSQPLVVPAGTALTGSILITDPDDSVLTIAQTSFPGKGAVSALVTSLSVTPPAVFGAPGVATFSYRPNVNAAGADSFIVDVTDGHGGTVSYTVPIVVIGAGAVRPWIVSDAPMEIDSGGSISYDIHLDLADYTGASLAPPANFTVTVVNLSTSSGPGAATAQFGASASTTIPSATLTPATLTITDGGVVAPGTITLGVLVTDAVNNTAHYQPVTIHVVPAGGAGG